MIQKSEIDAAISSADQFLEKQAEFAWVKRSSLLERAYYLGLFAGLRGIAKEEHLGGMVVASLARTLFSRDSDDTFHSTPVGQSFSSLKSSVLSDEKRSASRGSLDRLRKQVDQLDRHWRSLLRQSEDLFTDLQALMVDTVATSDIGDTHRSAGLDQALERLDSDELRQRQYCLLQRVEGILREVSLLETDHRRWANFFEERDGQS